MTRVLIVGAIGWPMLLGAAAWHRVDHPAGERGAWSAIVYALAGRVCHQMPERTIHTADVAWPVCARCSGLYLAAPLGIAGLLLRRRGRALQPVPVVIAAAIPTVLTVLWEWAGFGMPSHVVRLATAVPLGAAITYTLLAVTHRID